MLHNVAEQVVSVRLPNFLRFLNFLIRLTNCCWNWNCKLIRITKPKLNVLCCNKGKTFDFKRDARKFRYYQYRYNLLYQYFGPIAYVTSGIARANFPTAECYLCNRTVDVYITAGPIMHLSSVYWLDRTVARILWHPMTAISGLNHRASSVARSESGNPTAATTDPRMRTPIDFRFRR